MPPMVEILRTGKGGGCPFKNSGHNREHIKYELYIKKMKRRGKYFPEKCAHIGHLEMLERKCENLNFLNCQKVSKLTKMANFKEKRE